MKWRALENFDVTTMTDLWNRSFEDYIVPINMSEEDFMTRINTLNLSTKTSVIAELDDEKVGMMLYGEEEFKGEKTAWIGGMGVIKSMRQHGVGKEILLKTIELAKDEEVDKLFLEVIEGNERAIKLYTKMGFTLINKVSVGKIKLTSAYKKKDFLELKVSAAIENWQRNLEPLETAWQNRLARNYNMYTILLNKEEVGYLYWIEESFSLKQLILKEPTQNIVEGVLALLYEKFGEVQVNVGNFNMEQKEYAFLIQLGMNENLRQLHMCYNV
ncbi:MAG: GNAT family N-acetyltransferase [Kurthia sp.]